MVKPMEPMETIGVKIKAGSETTEHFKTQEEK